MVDISDISKYVPNIFTGARSSGIWELAKDLGFNNMEEFWTYAGYMEWTYYDVLRIVSP